MQGYSQITIVGNLAKDAYAKQPGGFFLAECSVAVNEKIKGKETVYYMDVKLWGDFAKAMVEYLKKGQAILFSGELKQESWTDKTTGDKRSKFIVHANRCLLLGGNSQKGGNASPNGTESKTEGGDNSAQPTPWQEVQPAQNNPEGWNTFKGQLGETPF